MQDKPRLPPLAERRAVSTSLHGRERRDDFAWLRADNWREVMRDPAVLAADIRAHLEAENAWTDAALAHTADLQQRLFDELKGRIKEDDSSVPEPDGPYAYAIRYLTGAQHPRYVRTAREGGGETVLLDADAMAEGKAYFRLAGADHSPDHRLLVYAADETGSEYYTIRLRDIATGEDFGDAIPGTTGGAVWSADSRFVFYTWLDENHRPRRVMRHRVGTDVADDELVYEEHDPGFFVGVGQTQSRRFVVIHANDHETSEVRLVDAGAPESAPRLVFPRSSGIEYRVEHRGDDLIVLTNAGGAEDFRIVAAPLDHDGFVSIRSESMNVIDSDKPGRDAGGKPLRTSPHPAPADPSPDNWRDLVAHEPGRLILDAVAYRDHLVRLERFDGLPRIVVRRFSDGAEHAIRFDEEAYSLGMSHGHEFDTATLRFSYSSPTTPARVYDYDMESRERILRKEQEVPSGHDPSHYVTRRLHAPAPDGETVPVTVLHHRNTPLDGSAPCLLYGYGSYGIAIPAAFSTNALSLVNRGFVHAVAHVRGGKDKGYRWYREGKGAAKVNTFTDFIAAGEHLAAEGFTARGRIVAQGGSAGGLLMGAVANMAPDLFLGIVAEVPFVDVLSTMLDASLPLTPPEWPEWGNPIERAEAYETIAAYSPYDNVAAQDYPHMLVLAGLSDPRVTYWEPAKWVAKLRHMRTDSRLMLLKTNMDAGHAGAAGRFERLREIALIHAFVLEIAGRAGT